MRTLTYFIAVSLDGLIAAPDGSFDAFPTEGDHMDTILRDWTDTIPTHVQTALGLTADQTRFDTVVMGWNTYRPALEAGIRSPYQHLRQIAVSRHHHDVPDELELTADPARRMRELKAEDGSGIWLAGGGTLAATLIDQIDRIVLKVNPILLGAGRPLFRETPQAVTRFDLYKSIPYHSGVVINEYERRKETKAGTEGLSSVAL